MKQFFKMMFASTLGVLLAIGIIITIFTISLIGAISSIGGSDEYVPKANTVFKLSLNGSISENVEESPLALLMGGTGNASSMRDVLKSIRLAKENKNIKGIYLEAGALSAGTANIDAIRRALIDFKESGKFVVAYADNFTQGCYYLCSVADQVYLNPQGSLLLRGMASQTTFYKGILNKIGVEMQIFKVGTYKGAVEPFMLDHLSEENREQITSYQQSIWGNVTNGIAQSRNISVNAVNEFANEGIFFSDAAKAVEYGLIDGVKYQSDVEEYVKELAGQTDKRLKTAGIDKVKFIKDKSGKKGDQVAVLYAEGEIMPDEGSSIYSNNENISEKLANELIKLKNDDKVKAVVLRVNSPGGSAYISEQIWYQVVELKKVKPIVVSMGNVAASGGYYISCAANKIVAEANTITGSIGIFGIFPNASGLFNKLDVTTDVVKTNQFADLGDFSRPMREDEKTLLQSYVERGYDTFITRCADGRGMSKEQIDAIGQGRVWTGEQALERGLVDELGGVDTAIRSAAELADLSNYEIVHVSGNKDFLKDLLDKQLSDMKVSLVKEALGDEYNKFKALKEIRSNLGIQTRLLWEVDNL